LKNAIQFGAGNIGRGFMGQLFWEIKYHIIFIESNKKLIDSINKEKKYPLKLLDAYKKNESILMIDNIESILIDDSENVFSAIESADVISTAVGVSHLEDISSVISEGLSRRKYSNPHPIDIYLCENSLEAPMILKKFVYKNLNSDIRKWTDKNVGFVGMIVARMVPQSIESPKKANPLFAVADAYHKLIYDGKASKSYRLPISGMYPVDNYLAEFDRKLFTYNLGHAALGYLGYLKGYRYVHDSFKDNFIKKIFNGALDETSAALARKYPGYINEDNQNETRKDVLTRFGNPMLEDTVVRIGRDPLRKLGRSDRIIGSLNLCLDKGVFPDNIIKVCASAYNFDYYDDDSAVKLSQLIEKDGIEKTIKKVSGIEPDTDIGKKIIKYFYEYRDIKNKISYRK
jgi:mannitol-1-phosphate 5-dehydrogenase